MAYFVPIHAGWFRSGNEIVPGRERAKTMADELLTVLVVDDDKDFLLIWRLLLRSHPRIATVNEADCGEDAIRQLILHGPFDVVLADAWMADGSGYDVADFAKRTYPSMPVVLTSGAEGLEQQALQHGATTFVPKQHTIHDGLGDLLCSLADRTGGST